MAAFVLHLCKQDRLALEGWRAADPVSLRQHADDFGMRVLRNLADQGLPIRLRHPVARFYLAIRRELGVEVPYFRRIGARISRRFHRLPRQVYGLGVHESLSAIDTSNIIISRPDGQLLYSMPNGG